MLNVWGSRNGINCDGSTRRDFLKVGALGMGGWLLPDLLRRGQRRRPRAPLARTPPSSGCGLEAVPLTSKPSIPR